MAQGMYKKQIGMYTFTLEDDGSLRIQAPTLFKPVVMDAKQTHDLAHWLAEAQQIELPTNAVNVAAPVEHIPLEEIVTPAATPVQTVVPQPVAQLPSVEPETTKTPEEIARGSIEQYIESIRANYPESLTLENRDRLIEQIARIAEIRPLMSRGQVSRKQIMLWADQAIAQKK